MTNNDVGTLPTSIEGKKIAIQCLNFEGTFFIQIGHLLGLEEKPGCKRLELVFLVV